MKLVPLGMPAEIIVIVKDQNAGCRPGLLTIEIRRRQAADAPTHYHQIVFLARLHRLACGFPERAVTQCVGDFESAGVTAAHSCAGWRVVAGGVLRRGGGHLVREQTAKPWTGKRATHSECDAVQEIPPCDIAVHAKLAVTGSTSVFVVEIRHGGYPLYSPSPYGLWFAFGLPQDRVNYPVMGNRIDGQSLLRQAKEEFASAL